MKIRLNAMNNPLVSPGKLKLTNEAWTEVVLDELDEETAEQIASFARRGLVGAHPDDAEMFRRVFRVEAPDQSTIPPPRVEHGRELANMRAQMDELAQTNAELQAVNQGIEDAMRETVAEHDAAKARIAELEAQLAAKARIEEIAEETAGAATAEAATTKEERPSRKR